MIGSLTVDEQMKLLNLAKERLNSVAELIESAIIIIDTSEKSEAEMKAELYSKLDEALIALQGKSYGERRVK